MADLIDKFVRASAAIFASRRFAFRRQSWRPLISVVIPNYNHGQFIKQNLDGLLSQTYGKWEAVIVDDASTDDSRETISCYVKNDPRFRAIYLPLNEGAIAAFLKGYAELRGELLFCSAADDFVSDPSFFDSAVKRLSIYPHAAGFVARTRIVDPELSKTLWDTGPLTSGYQSPSEAITAFFEQRLFIPGSSAIWRAPLVKELGFSEDLGPQIDYFLNHALAMKWGLVTSDRVSATMRKVLDSYSAVVDDKDFFARHRTVFDRLLELVPDNAVSKSSGNKWKADVINARLAITRQQEFFATVRNFFGAIETWEESSLPTRFIACRNSLLNDIAQMEQELAIRIEDAERTLDMKAPE